MCVKYAVTQCCKCGWMQREAKDGGDDFQEQQQLPAAIN